MLFLVSFGFGTVLFLVLRRFPRVTRGRFRKRNLKHAKECSIQQRRGFACGVCRWKRRFGCSRNSAVSAARFESGFRERDGQGQHWRGPHSHGGFLKMIVCESGGHANGLTYFIFRFLRRPLLDGGHHREVVRFVKMLRYPLVSCRYPVFSVNACIYSTLRPFLCQHLGALPQTPASLAAPQGRRLKPNHLTLWRSVGSAPRRQG